MMNRIAAAKAALRARLAHKDPIEIWLLGAADGVVTFIVLVGIVAVIAQVLK